MTHLPSCLPHHKSSRLLCLATESTPAPPTPQRVGCDRDPETNAETEQRPGCGGFGKGNFKELFRSIEEHETKIGINAL